MSLFDVPVLLETAGRVRGEAAAARGRAHNTVARVRVTADRVASTWAACARTAAEIDRAFPAERWREGTSRLRPLPHRPPEDPRPPGSRTAAVLDSPRHREEVTDHQRCRVTDGGSRERLLMAPACLLTVIAWRIGGLSLDQLWRRHLELGGDVDRAVLAAYLHRSAGLPVVAHNVVAQVLNEALWDIGSPSLVPRRETVVDPDVLHAADD